MKCANCGWDNANFNTRCERCNAPLKNAVGDDNPSNLRATVRDPIIENQPAPKKTVTESGPPKPGTINMWGGGVQFGAPKKGICRLTPMPSGSNERQVSDGLMLKDEYNELNRTNLDPTNNTISQKLQAIISHKGDKWYIKDQSSYKTTFVLASEDVPLNDGDIILLGNKRFIFTEE